MAHAQSHKIVPHAVEVFEKGVSNMFYGMVAAIEKANRRKAGREIERVLGGREAKFTDESESTIERH